MNSTEKQRILILLIFFITSNLAISQTDNKVASSYTKIKSYFSIVHPIATFTRDENHFNFNGSYNVGFPVGINFLQSDEIEFVPTISVNDSTSSVTGLLFHPSAIYRNIGGFNFLTRLAFNTNGRYGFTAVVNKPNNKRPI